MFFFKQKSSGYKRLNRSFTTFIAVPKCFEMTIQMCH